MGRIEPGREVDVLSAYLVIVVISPTQLPPKTVHMASIKDESLFTSRYREKFLILSMHINDDQEAVPLHDLVSG